MVPVLPAVSPEGQGVLVVFLGLLVGFFAAAGAPFAGRRSG